MNSLNDIKELINQGNVDEAICILDQLLLSASDSVSAEAASKEEISREEAYYLRGNAYRKKGNWQQALNNYQAAIELNPHSPAVQAQQMAMDILNFFNKDMFNQ